MSGPLDRTGNQVREEADEETILEKRLGSLNPPLVDVHNVGDFLKRIKRYARGKDNANQGERDIVNSKSFEAGKEGAREEIEIFKDPQNHEIQDEREDKPLPPVRVRAAGSNFLRDQEVHRGAADHESEEAPIPPTVEKVAGQKEEDILGAVMETPVKQHDRYQEEEIGRGVKEHGVESKLMFPDFLWRAGSALNIAGGMTVEQSVESRIRDQGNT
jgi:hypothetical protein